MKTAPLWIGIDVAKDQLDIPIGASGESGSVVFRRIDHCWCDAASE
jgi:hypothetical protein